MQAIRDLVVEKMHRIARIMVIIILFLSTTIQIFSVRQTARQNARQIFEQVGQILEENSRELERVQEEYATRCLNDARTVAYILKGNPSVGESVEELREIAADVEVDEIHIFDANGVIVTGTHPEYWGYSFDDGEQIGFFKPLLTDYSLELMQDITPNTADHKLVQYSALWNDDRTFIVQIGMYPSTVLQATQKNELSYIFSLLGTGVGYDLYAISPETQTVVGSTIVSDVGKDLTEVGFQKEHLWTDKAFYTEMNSKIIYCLSQKIGGNYVIWASPLSTFYQSVLINNLFLLAGLVFISIILVYAVTSSVNNTVIEQLKRINWNLRAIQHGDLNTAVDVKDSKEFLELSDHINSMVASLLRNSEKLKMSEKIRQQKEELEQQHKQLEIAVERAEKASRAKSEFLFNMSHDIRTPMNAILGFTNLALESCDLETQRMYLENIDVSSKQLLDLINNILELSRIENHKIVIEEDLVEVKSTCSRLCTIFDGELRKKNLSFNVSQDITHPYLYIDATHYSQIFLNIVGNSIKYTPNGGTITISFRELPGDSGDVCTMETIVQDNGIGMSAEFLAHAYDSFSRERTSTASGIQGTGLGLAIVKNLVDLMRGTIAIESQQGQGTKVIIRLPHRVGQAPAVEPPEEAALPEAALFEGKRILMAEDIDINAMIATKLLTGKGFLVDRARDGVECVAMQQKAEAGYYDLILMDIQMPNMDGYQAAMSIRAFADKAKASVPILALTANAFKEDCDKALEAGMNGHIAKPLDAGKMFRLIAETLREQASKQREG